MMGDGAESTGEFTGTVRRVASRLEPVRYIATLLLLILSWIAVQIVHHRLAPALLPPGTLPLRAVFGAVLRIAIGTGFLLAAAARFRDAGFSGKWALLLLGFFGLTLASDAGFSVVSGEVLFSARQGLLFGLALLPSATSHAPGIGKAVARALSASSLFGLAVWLALPPTGLVGLMYWIGGASYRDQALMEYTSAFQLQLPMIVDEYSSITGAIYNRNAAEFHIEFTVALQADEFDLDALREETLSLTRTAECGPGGEREWARLFAVGVGVVFDYRDKSGTPIASIAVPPDLCEGPLPGDAPPATGA